MSLAAPAPRYDWPLHSDPATAEVKAELIRLLPDRLVSAKVHRREPFAGGREYLEVHLVVEPSP